MVAVFEGIVKIPETASGLNFELNYESIFWTFL